jgi:hypothetical protein
MRKNVPPVSEAGVPLSKERSLSSCPGFFSITLFVAFEDLIDGVALHLR